MNLEEELDEEEAYVMSSSDNDDSSDSEFQGIFLTFNVFLIYFL